MDNVVNLLKNSSGFVFPPLLLLISNILGYRSLFLLLLSDFVIINPGLKKLVGLFGLQSKRPYCTDVDSFKCYGMPSGHTEMHFILLTVLLLHLYNNGSNDKKLLYSTIVVGLMTVITMWQRFTTGSHTPEQICCGAAVGAVIGYFYYTYFFKFIGF